MGRNTGTASCICTALEDLPEQAGVWSAEVTRDAPPRGTAQGRSERRHEALLLLLPLIYCIAERMVRDTIQDVKAAVRRREKRSGQRKKRQKKTAPRLLSQNKREAEFAGDIVR